MKWFGGVIGVLLAIVAGVGIGLYVNGNQTDTVIVPQAVNQASDDASRDAADDSAARSDDDATKADDRQDDSSSDPSSAEEAIASNDDDYELYGTLVALTDRDVTISFSGKEETYPLAARHEIDDDTPRVGDRIKLELNLQDEVKEVDRENDDDQDDRDDSGRDDDGQDDRD